MTTYRERHLAGHYNADNQQAESELDADNLPSRHAALDDIATARGIIWAEDNLSVSDKQDQIRAAL